MFRSKHILFAAAAFSLGALAFQDEANARPCRRSHYRRQCRVQYQTPQCCALPGQPPSGAQASGAFGTCMACPTTILVDYGSYKMYEMTICPSTDAGTIDGNFVRPGCTNDPNCTPIYCNQIVKTANGGTEPNSVDWTLARDGLADFPSAPNYPGGHVSHKDDFPITFQAFGNDVYGRLWKFDHVKNGAHTEVRSGHQVQGPVAHAESTTVISRVGYSVTVQVDQGEPHSGDVFTVVLVRPGP